MPVTWNRALAPLWVLSLGIIFLVGLLVTLATCGRQDNSEGAALHGRRSLQTGLILYLLGHSLEEGHSQLRVSNLPTPEENGYPDFGAFVQQLLYLPGLGCQVVGPYVGSEADLPHGGGFLGLPGLFDLLGVEVAELTIVKDAAYGRVGGG